MPRKGTAGAAEEDRHLRGLLYHNHRLLARDVMAFGWLRGRPLGSRRSIDS